LAWAFAAALACVGCESTGCATIVEQLHSSALATAKFNVLSMSSSWQTRHASTRAHGESPGLRSSSKKRASGVPGCSTVKPGFLCDLGSSKGNRKRPPVGSFVHGRASFTRGSRPNSGVYLANIRRRCRRLNHDKQVRSRFQSHVFLGTNE